MWVGAVLATLKKLAKSRAFWYVGGILALVAAVWIYGNRQYNRGYDQRDAEYQQIIKEEKERIEAANKAALEEARQEIERLKERSRVRDAHLKRLFEEATGDPSATDGAFSADSVRRLNSIR